MYNAVSMSIICEVSCLRILLYVYTEQYPAEGLFLFPICQSNFSCQNVSKLNTKRIYSSCYNIAVFQRIF